jgi:hypothetical protein
MKSAGITIVAIFALLMIGLATAEYMEDDEPVDTEIFGFKFNSSQSVSGVGLANSYRYLTANPQVIHSHSSGSGAYSYESAATVLYDIESKSGGNFDDYLSSDRKIKVQESVSAAYAPTTLNIPGSFKVAPIKSLWRDAVCAQNSGGVALTAIFDEARSLNKEIMIDTAGSSRYENLNRPNIGFSLYADMNLIAAFNGTARLGMIQNGIDDPRDSITMIDEFYRGSFSLEKKMKISIVRTLTSNDDDWLPCCFGGYLTEPTYYQKGPKGFGSNLTNIFDCTCFKPISSAGCSK